MPEPDRPFSKEDNASIALRCLQLTVMFFIITYLLAVPFANPLSEPLFLACKEMKQRRNQRDFWRRERCCTLGGAVY